MKWRRWDNGHTFHRRLLRELLFLSKPTGPFCRLRKNKHAAPFSKRREGKLRRTARRFKLEQKAIEL